MNRKKAEGRNPKAQRKPAVRASITFPPDLYETLEEMKKSRSRKKCRWLGSCETPQRSTLQTSGHMTVCDSKPSPMNLIKSKRRVADHGEVLTPGWLVEKMLDLVKGETARVDSRFLEPACGSGNFLVPVLQRKLAAVEAKFGKSDFEKRHYALLALMCIYGIELLADNIAECRANVLEIFAEYLGLDESDELFRAASYVLSQNVVHGDALTMCSRDRKPISFAEWGYLGKGKFQRRDFYLTSLTLSSSFSAADSLFSQLGTHEVFTPTRTYPPMTISELAVAAFGDAPKEAE